jgi:type I restriction enzyme R subunit
MSHQSEALLENDLIRQLISLLKTQLEAFNKTKFTAKEFDAILNHLAKGNVFEKAKTLKRSFSFK